MPNRPLPGSISSSFPLRAPRRGSSDAESLSVVDLIRAGTIDPELAALAWLTVEARVPLLVGAGARLAGKTTLLNALLAFLPPTAAVRELEGFSESFGWLPDAARLGWRPDPVATSGADGRDSHALREPILSPASGYLIAAELSPHLPWYTWGEQARVAIRALSLGYGLGATIHADSLEEVLDSLRGHDVRLTDDELSHLGVVLILRPLRGPSGAVMRRVVAAHYIRPVSRDVGGHVQRLAPAVLSTWDAGKDSFEDFSWGVVAELATRVGRSRADFESEHARRRDVLTTLAASGTTRTADVRRAIDAYRHSEVSA